MVYALKSMVEASPVSGSDSSVVDESADGSLTERLTLGLRQGALMAVALLIAGQLAERLRPPAALDRGIIDTPFLWAIVVWAIALLFHAVAFERSVMRQLERGPLAAGVAAGGLVFVIGLIGVSGVSFGRRVLYVFANSLGAVLFWWGVFSLGYLVTQRLSEPDPNSGNPNSGNPDSGNPDSGDPNSGNPESGD